MRMFGSLQNRMMESVNAPLPVVGMGVTEFYYTDREPWEIVAVKDARHITVRKMDAKRVDNNGMSECQDWVLTSNEKNYTAELFLTKAGEWRERIGRSLGCNRFGIGKARKYIDPCF